MSRTRYLSVPSKSSVSSARQKAEVHARPSAGAAVPGRSHPYGHGAQIHRAADHSADTISRRPQANKETTACPYIILWSKIMAERHMLLNSRCGSALRM